MPTLKESFLGELQGVLGKPVLDNDGKVLGMAAANASLSGEKIILLRMDFFRMGKVFAKDSFDAVTHGGVLDVLDSPLGAAPVGYLLLMWLAVR